MSDNYGDLLVNADIDEVYAVNNKTISAPKTYTDIAVKGDNYSNSLIFKMNRFIDGVDISNKTIQIHYVNAEKYSDAVDASSIAIADDYVLFSWRIDSNVTHAAGTVSFIVKVSDTDYSWRSKPAVLTIVDTLDCEISPPNYFSSWAENVENKIFALQGKVVNIEDGLAEAGEDFIDGLDFGGSGGSDGSGDSASVESRLSALETKIDDLSNNLEDTFASYLEESFQETPTEVITELFEEKTEE